MKMTPAIPVSLLILTGFARAYALDFDRGTSSPESLLESFRDGRAVETPIAAPARARGARTENFRASGGEADLSLFFRRLEDVGFDTRELRAVRNKIEVFYREPRGDAYAEYGYITDNLYIPHEFKESGSRRIRYNLAGHEIDTLIHECVHAARDVSAREDAPLGTPAREHYEAVKYIWADLRSRSLLYRFAWMKADEVSGYFMGSAISRVFEAVDEIVVYNRRLGGSRVKSVEEARRLGGKFLMPTRETAANAWEKGFIDRYGRPFGSDRVYDVAVFQENVLTSPALIHWEENQWVKDALFKNVLGLNPPRDISELLNRLNSLDNEWVRGVRDDIAKARLANAFKQSTDRD